tara:strand:+ start:305 stop:529 length:225 start_codon:yes stop_codon:yes gene_type:complete
MSSSLGNNPALTLYRNLQVEKGKDMDVKATRGFLARGQADKVRKEMDVKQPSVRVAKHMSIIKRKRDEINNDRA